MAEAVQRGQSDDVTAMLFGDPEPGQTRLWPPGTFAAYAANRRAASEGVIDARGILFTAYPQVTSPGPTSDPLRLRIRISLGQAQHSWRGA
jgi:hypothetical protein